MERRKLTKAERMTVYNKTNGHCAYCGAELLYKDMQVDHVISIRNGGKDELKNMLPACRSCNHYKGGGSVESFRKMLEAIPTVLIRDSSTYKNAVRFGLVVPKSNKIVFYFERCSHE